MKKLRNRYAVQKGQAKARGIGFLLTFNEWLFIWQKSGVLHLRGCGRGKYVMARYGDNGPYTIGNVKICLHGENNSESWVDKNKLATRLKKMSLSKFGIKRGPQSPETRAKIGAANLGKKRSPEAILKMRLAHLGSKWSAKRWQAEEKRRARKNDQQTSN